MTDLLAELAATEDRAEALRRAIRQGPCREYGHAWEFYGGRNAGCGDGCNCSVPVNMCNKCGDCDYGDNAEADQIRQHCAEVQDHG